MNHIELKTATGPVVYTMDDLDFINVMCDLEAKGVDIMGMMSSETREGQKIFTFMRGVLSMMLNEDERTAGKKLSEHIKNGGDINSVFEAFAQMMNDAGFGEAEQTETTEVPQAEEPKAEEPQTESVNTEALPNLS